MVSNGIEIGKRALLASRYAMDVIGNNLANVNTPGYSRQKIDLKTSTPVDVPAYNKYKPMASLGTGVQLAQVQRIRDDFLDAQMRDVSQELGQWTQKEVSYQIIESIFNEPSDSGIEASLDKFWNAWDELATPDPSSSGARSSIISQASVLANSLQSTRTRLGELQSNNNDNIELTVEKINDLSTQIASINGRIVEAEASSNANDLRDERTKLVTELSGLVNIEYYEDTRGSSTIAVGGTFLVSGRNSNEIQVKSNADNYGYYDVYWVHSNEEVAVSDGELYGLLQSRDVIVQGLIDDLDNLAGAIITNVNSVHQQGYDLNGDSGLQFFKGSDASDIRVNDEILYEHSKIAASSRSTNIEGNGENALAMAGLREENVLGASTATINEYYQAIITDLGSQSWQASSYVETDESLVRQIENQIENVSGVSVDEEMTELIKFEHAYQAAAKYIHTVDQTLELLMNLL